ncbi:MAG TPA: histidine kinase [Bryobacteraceae bacterium]|jgi:signal transduction histidine kinase
MPLQPDNLSHRQTRIVFFFGFGGLLFLMGFLGISAISALSDIRVREDGIRGDYLGRERVLQDLRASIYTSGTHIRDFLLDTDEALAREHSEQFLETQRQIEDGTAKYRTLVRPGDEQAFRQFAEELASYMHAITPVLSWTPAERKERSSSFVQNELLPRRMSALSLADRTQKISERQLDESSYEVTGMLESIRGRLLFLLILAIALGMALAGVALWRLLRLESEAKLRFDEIVSTREELKRLSAELLSAQESERRRISRELHDEVGQVLSAIMLGLGNLRSAIKDGNTAEAFGQLQLVEDMTERNASVVRNISLLLRPTMLDDLGLLPALKWYSREVSRTGPMTVEVEAEAFVDDLPDEHRTCVFRIVQEAVRNASRHAAARQVRIQISEREGLLELSVRDDGKGFDPAHDAGLGILGMQERVEHLAGKLEVKSQPGLGTAVLFTLPIPGGTSGSVSRNFDLAIDAHRAS